MRGLKARPAIIAFNILLALVFYAPTLFAQTATVTRNVNLRSDPSGEYPPIRLLTPSEPPLTLIDPMPESGYYQAMERWTALQRSDSLHDGIVPIGIVASELYEDQITKDVQRAGASRLSGLQQ